MRRRTCRCGRIHYGQYGAAGLVLSHRDGRILLARRSEYVPRSGTWAFPGGSREPGETPAECAVRETEEELGVPPEAVVVTGSVPGVDHGDWTYTYVLASLAPDAPTPTFRLNWEHDQVAWFPPNQVAGLRLHPDLRRAWPDLRDQW